MDETTTPANHFDYKITVRARFFDLAKVVTVSGPIEDAIATARELRKSNGFVSLFDIDGSEIVY